MRPEAVAKRVQRDGLPQARCFHRVLEQPRELARGQWPILASAGAHDPFLKCMGAPHAARDNLTGSELRSRVRVSAYCYLRRLRVYRRKNCSAGLP